MNNNENTEQTNLESSNIEKASDGKTNNDSSLDALVGEELSNARENLRSELGREPTREEVDEWINAHTEGY